ncbi:MAG: Coenzyme F420 hydrogenase/dehydrogenase, beta subunit C-terminal domain [Eubacterium sp.]|nr:Coenzyme F420 hydrogenase/dehydrogenase, beta subunit C-terminal domain [Eubacterium sp.]
MNVEYIDTAVYAGRIKNRNSLMKSSSGGAFTAISDVFLSNGDAVICSIYNFAKKETLFNLITTNKERDAAMGSKYMQSKPGDIFAEAKDWLMCNPEKKLLFIGMGCQAEGFRKYSELKGIRERVYIVDIICHGVTSPKIWREYAASLEKQYKGTMEYLTFRDKRKGWKFPTAIAVINGEEILINQYLKVFYNRCANRPACHVCPYTTTKRNTDITVGDFWHIEKKIPDFYDPAGNSLFLLNTNRGAELFEKIKKVIDYRESNTIECWQFNLERPTPVSGKRNAFWIDYEKYGVDYIIEKYGNLSIIAKVKNRVLEIIERIR